MENIDSVYFTFRSALVATVHSYYLRHLSYRINSIDVTHDEIGFPSQILNAMTVNMILGDDYRNIKCHSTSSTPIALYDVLSDYEEVSRLTINYMNGTSVVISPCSVRPRAVREKDGKLLINWSS